LSRKEAFINPWMLHQQYEKAYLFQMATDFSQTVVAFQFSKIEKSGGNILTFYRLDKIGYVSFPLIT